MVSADLAAQERKEAEKWTTVVKRTGKATPRPPPLCAGNSQQATWQCEVTNATIGDVPERCDLPNGAKRTLGAHCTCVFSNGLGGWGGSAINKRDTFVVAGKVVVDCHE